MMQHKKKLSDECIVEFEKKIKPKFILFMYLSFLPMIALCLYLISAPEYVPIRFIILGGLGTIVFTAAGRFLAAKVISKSKNATHFKYALNYFIFVGTGELFFLLAVVSALKDYIAF
jgi:hypothetical protein